MPNPANPVSAFSEFLHGALHEIAGPAGRIHRIADLLDLHGDTLKEELRSWLYHMRTSTSSLDETLTAIRRYVAALDLPDVPSSFSLISAAETVASAMSVEVKTPDDQCYAVTADRARVELVLRELISNAAKFQDERPPDIQVLSKLEHNQMVVSVADNGIGIDPLHRDRIFKPFVRLWGDRFPGSGLGLTIARTVVQEWNGNIWVEACPDRGSIFRFTVPL